MDAEACPDDPASTLPQALRRRAPACLRHCRSLPERPGRRAPWPLTTPDALVAAMEGRGIGAPWQHQVEVAEASARGEHAVVATGTASGKTLAMWLPTLSALLAGPDDATVLYLAPTKALAHDQLAALESLALPGLRPATYDGDTPADERRWVRAHANFVLTNPDLIHRSLLPRHTAWTRFLRNLEFILIDEAHHYRGMFGSHVALVIRRLRRLASQLGANPLVVAASATMSHPESVVARLIGSPVTAITTDWSAHGAVTAALWEPPEAVGIAHHDPDQPAPRRSALAETADLIADLVCDDQRSLAFISSRRGAEAVAQMAREAVAEVDPTDADLPHRIAAYRGGYLPEERRALERGLRDGDLRAVATTNALELGIDISGLDAVVVSGWPGTRASLWQQWGRAGRRGGSATAVFVAREDPLDRFVLDHPGVIFDQPVEAVVFDQTNPHILRPHLLAACAETPLTQDDAVSWFGDTAPGHLDDLAGQGLLRKRRTGYYWTQKDSPADHIDLRGEAASPIRIVEEGTGRLLGTVEASRAPATVHPQAVYVHQGLTHLVSHLDLDESVAFVHREDVTHTTTATEIADYRILTVEEEVTWGDARLCLGEVEVTSQVVGFVRRRVATGELLGQESLTMPERTLRTRGVWWTVSDEQVASLIAGGGVGIATESGGIDIAGAAHAAEHASIGLMPLVATCDRWDIGGVSTPRHPDTDRCTVVVYDGHAGGAGFADRGFAVAATWLRATRDLIAGCPCSRGCPSCVQSPKCGNGNEPLDKAGAVRLLDVLLAGAPTPTTTDPLLLAR